jgi:GT2 family glycosyltransferase
MECSIIVINKNDKGLRDTLVSLNDIEKPKGTEVIVVDGSNHKMDWIKQEFPKVKWIYFTQKGKKKISIPEQRNAGIQASKGKIIVFTDASCVPTRKTWLLDLIEPIRKEGEAFVRGSVTDRNFLSIHTEDNHKIYVNECPTINMAISREVVEKVGLFDESFSYGSDMDFSWRAIKKGFKIRYIEAAAVSHNFGDTGQNIKRYFYYGEARGRLYLKHPEKIHLVKNYELKSAIYFILISIFPFAYPSNLYLAVLAILFILPLPNNPVQEALERYVFTYGLLRGMLSLVIEKVRKTFH